MSEPTLKAPTQTVVSTVIMVGGTRLRGTIHTPSGIGDNPTGALQRLLTSGVRFIPLTPGGAGSRDRTIFVQLAQALAVEVEAPQTEDPALDEQLPASLHLPQELVYAGVVLAAVPRQQSRLSDALNRADDFIRMRVGNKAVFVRREHVLYAQERDSA